MRAPVPGTPEAGDWDTRPERSVGDEVANENEDATFDS